MYSQLLQAYDVKVNVLGRTDLLPQDVQKAVRELEELTAGHTT